MGDERVMRAARSSWRRKMAILAAVSFAVSCSMFASPASSQSLGDRFKSLFGGKSEEPAQGAPPSTPEGESDLTCPPVSIRAGANRSEEHTSELQSHLNLVC